MRNSSTKHSIRAYALLAFFVTFLLAFPSFSQQQVAVPGIVSQLTLDDEGRIKCELHADDAIAKSHHHLMKNKAAARNAKFKTKKKKGSTGATIFVDYYNFDPAFPADQLLQAITAFQSAVDIWAQHIDSEVPIFIAAVFQPLDEDVLGSAGPTQIYANYPGLERDTWYGNALADKLAGEDLNPVVYDIVANFSTVFPNWYFGTDANTPETDFDFRTVVLHELCHGLGFFGSMFVDNATGIGSWGFGIPDPVFPAIYDRLAHTRPGRQLLKENKFANFSTELGDALLGGPLEFRGPNIVQVTKGKGARIFTVLDLGETEIPGLTNIWLPGSSYSHLDFFTYAEGENGLMVPFLFEGLAYDNPGPIAKAIFDDMGWNGKVNRPFISHARLSPSATPAESQSSLRVYPNQVQNYFVLDKGNENSGGLRHAQLTDLLGRTYPLTFTDRNTRYVDFDLSSLAIKPGIYFLQLEYNNQKAEVLRVLKALD